MKNSCSTTEKSRKATAFLLALIMIITVLIFPTSADKSAVPTIYVDDSVWYKHTIYPLLIKDGCYYVPSSVFESFDGVESKFDEKYNCLMLSRDDGRYVSINLTRKKAMTGDGMYGKLTVIPEKNEYYVDATLVSGLLGFVFSKGKFYDTDVVRITDKTSDIDLPSLVEMNRLPNSSLDGITQGGNNVGEYRNTIGVTLDISVYDIEQQAELLEAISELKIKATFIVTKDFIANSLNMKSLKRINAGGSDFAIRVSGENEKDILAELNAANDLLERLFRQKTRLIYAEKCPQALASAGYIAVFGSLNVSTLDIKNLVFGQKDILFLDQADKFTLSKFAAVVTRAEEKGLSVTAVSRTAGD